MTDFFDLPDDNFVQRPNTGEKKQDPNIYNPDPNLFNGSYKSVFRYIPYIFDKSLSKFTKYSAKFYNPLTKESLYIDCPSNVGQPSILWDIERVVKGLEKEEPELHKKLKDTFSRWHSHWAPVYIKKDPQRPDLEGQIKFFKFSYQINELIEAQINPEENELIDNIKKINPFHLLEGKDFICSVGKKTKTFRDWSKCKFMDEVTPFVFSIGDQKVKVENNEKSIKLVQEFLKKNTPKLDEYFHKEWTDETYNKVAEAIISVIQPRPVLNMVLERTKDEKMKELILSKLGGTSQSSSTSTSKSNEIDDELEFKSETSIEVPLDDISSSSSSSEKDEYDALFENM